MEAALEGPAGRIALGDAVVTIGRALDNSLVVQDSKVSLHHTEIRPMRSGYSIIDLHSTNGTFVNEQRISSARSLKTLDKVRVGNTTYTYRVNATRAVAPNERIVRLFAPLAARLALPLAGRKKHAAVPQEATTTVVTPVNERENTPSPQAAWKQDKKRLLLLIGGSILLLGMVVGIFLAFMLARAMPSPSNVLATYCDALKNQDYQSAYNQLDTNSIRKFSALDFSLSAAQNGGSGKITACSVGNVHTTGSRDRATGTINFTYANTNRKAINYLLNSDGGHWRIVQSGISSPAATLALYCSAIRQHDYPAAYMLWSKDAQAVVSEEDFAAKFTRAAIDMCVASAVQEHSAMATANITYGAMDGSTMFYKAHLINEDGFWRLNDQQQ